MTEIKLKKGEPVERAIRRLKKKLDREQTLKKFRERRRFEKPSAKRRRKQKAARFAAMLKARHAEDILASGFCRMKNLKPVGCH